VFIVEPQDNEACFGGVARIKHVVDETKRNNENTIFLNAGDFFQVRKFLSFFVTLARNVFAFSVVLQRIEMSKSLCIKNNKTGLDQF
jgi:2',3'-cyclic-nucleotide 2'-phosphodiesterase (5'-nucleotidase family)